MISLLSMARGGQVSTSTASNFEFNVMIALTLGGMPSEGGTWSKAAQCFYWLLYRLGGDQWDGASWH